MIIPINLPGPSNGPRLPPSLAKLGNSEVVIIELQGSLEVEGDRSGQAVGKLKFEGDKPTLLIGHHLLEGKLVTLQKPLAVLHRAQPNEDDGTSYDMIGLVRRKIVFAKRPMPVINAAAVKQGMEAGGAKDDTEGKRKKLKLG